MKENFVIEYSDVVLVMKQKQRRKKRKERDKTRKQKKTKKKDRKERKKDKKKRETEKEKLKKGEPQKKLRRNKGRHSKINKKCLFLGGENNFFVLQSKERKGTTTNQKKTKTNK